MWIPKRMPLAMERARKIVKTYEETGCDIEKTAKIHWFKDTRSVYRYLKLAGYKLSPQRRDAKGRFLPKRTKLK